MKTTWMMASLSLVCSFVGALSLVGCELGPPSAYEDPTESLASENASLIAVDANFDEPFIEVIEFDSDSQPVVVWIPISEFTVDEALELSETEAPSAYLSVQPHDKVTFGNPRPMIPVVPLGQPLE